MMTTNLIAGLQNLDLVSLQGDSSSLPLDIEWDDSNPFLFYIHEFFTRADVDGVVLRYRRTHVMDRWVDSEGEHYACIAVWEEEDASEILA